MRSGPYDSGREKIKSRVDEGGKNREGGCKECYDDLSDEKYSVGGEVDVDRNSDDLALVVSFVFLVLVGS